MNKNKSNLSIKVLFLTVVLTFTFIAHANGPDVGAMAPDFEITQLDGTKFKLSDFKDKQSVYLVFWNSWCRYCMKKIPKLKMAQLNLSGDIRIIAVNTSTKDSVEDSLDFQKRFKTNFPMAFDHGGKVTDLYNVWGTPTEFIIDINGIIQHRDGLPDKLEDHIDQWNKKNISISQDSTSYFQ